MSEKWEELNVKRIPLASGNVQATVSIIRSTKNPTIKLVSLGKLFHSVAFKVPDWENILPVIVELVKEAKEA